MASAGGEEFLSIGSPELFTAGGFGRRLAEEFFFERGPQDGFDHLTAGRGAPVAVVGFSEEPLYESVDDHVAGAGIEGDDAFKGRTGGDGGEVGDPSDVLKNPPAASVGEIDIVEEGDERRALATGGHVGGAEVGDDGDAGGGGDQSRFAELPGAGEAASRVQSRRALVVDSLAVAADERRRDLRVADGGLDGLGVGEAEAPVQASEFGGVGVGRARLSGHGGEDGLAEGLGEGEGPVNEEGESGDGLFLPTQANGRLEWGTRVRRITRDFDQGDVDAVGGGAAHDAGDDHRGDRGHSLESSLQGRDVALSHVCQQPPDMAPNDSLASG